MTVEKRFPKGSKERTELEETYTSGVLNMMDSDRPNNQLIGGFNFIGATQAHFQSEGLKTPRDRFLAFAVRVVENVCRARAKQLGWTEEDVQEEIDRGVQIFESKNKSN